MFEPSKPMSWFYYIAITLFFVYVLYSLYYMTKRTLVLRQNNRALASSSSSSQRQQEPESQTLSIEDMIEREREDGKAKAFRLRQLMNAFHYEVYSEHTTIEAVSLVQESFREDHVAEGNDEDKHNNNDNIDDEEKGEGNKKKGGVRRTTLVLENNTRKLLPKQNSKRCLKKCTSTWDSSKFSYDGESLWVNGSIRTNGTAETAIIADGDESVTTLSRKLDKESPDAEPECVICLEPYEYGQVICSAKIQACGHIFHADCMQQWVKQNEECPLCRVKLIVLQELQQQQDQESA